MTYLQFHLTFLIPVIVVLLFLVRSKERVPYPYPISSVFSLCTIAFVYTTPWDNYLVYREIWTYEPDRILESLRIGFVPIEEYAFFVLQPILTSLFLFFFASRKPEIYQDAIHNPARLLTPRLLVGGVYLLLALAGLVLLLANYTRFTYFALIVVWACPVLSFQAFFGADRIWLYRHHFLPALIGCTAYLWLVDGIAIDWNIWHIETETSTGWTLLALPVEEAVFFLVTNLLVLNGLVLLFDVLGRRNLAKKATR